MSVSCGGSTFELNTIEPAPSALRCVSEEVKARVFGAVKEKNRVEKKAIKRAWF